MSYTPLATRFYFDTFSIEPHNGRVVYAFSTDAGHQFSHELTLEIPPAVNADELAPHVFALGMAELIHYWKAILAPQIIVHAGKLHEEQIAFWTKLYTKGLGEFFYVNQIDFRNLIHVESDANAPEIVAAHTTQSTESVLVPFGGGKDSLVSGELLKKNGKPFTWFELEPLSFASKLQAVSPSRDVVRVGRSVEKNFAPIVELVKQGAPNGHVPITATYMLSALLAAKIQGFSHVALSLERSANEGNVEYLGETINHQYSKTLEFEEAMQNYTRTYIDDGIQIFSLLRPWYELQIVREFVQYPQYFPYVTSCNRSLKMGGWCGECAKCAFMFAALSAFLPSEIVTTMFHKNLFAEESLLPLYEELIGMHVAKPFDCVGTFDENLLALYLSGAMYEKEGKPLPLLLTKLPIEKGRAHLSLLEEKGETARIPSGFQLI